MPNTQGGWQAELSTNRLGIGCCGAAKQGVYGLLLGTRTKHPGMGESNKWQIVGHTNPPHPARDWAPRIREAIDLSLRNSHQWALGVGGLREVGLGSKVSNQKSILVNPPRTVG